MKGNTNPVNLHNTKYSWSSSGKQSGNQIYLKRRRLLKFEKQFFFCDVKFLLQCSKSMYTWSRMERQSYLPRDTMGEKPLRPLRTFMNENLKAMVTGNGYWSLLVPGKSNYHRGKYDNAHFENFTFSLDTKILTMNLSSMVHWTCMYSYFLQGASKTSIIVCV